MYRLDLGDVRDFLAAAGARTPTSWPWIAAAGFGRGAGLASRRSSCCRMARTPRPRRSRCTSSPRGSKSDTQSKKVEGFERGKLVGRVWREVGAACRAAPRLAAASGLVRDQVVAAAGLVRPGRADLLHRHHRPPVPRQRRSPAVRHLQHDVDRLPRPHPAGPRAFRSRPSRRPRTSPPRGTRTSDTDSLSPSGSLDPAADSDTRSPAFASSVIAPPVRSPLSTADRRMVGLLRRFTHQSIRAANSFWYAGRHRQTVARASVTPSRRCRGRRRTRPPAACRNRPPQPPHSGMGRVAQADRQEVEPRRRVPLLERRVRVRGRPRARRVQGPERAVVLADVLVDPRPAASATRRRPRYMPR